MVFCDPPYNVNYGATMKDKLRGKKRKIANDDLGEDFEQFLRDACVNMLAVTKGAVYICMSSSEIPHAAEVRSAKRAATGPLSSMWAKNTFTMGRSDYQRQYEPILYGWKEGTDHFWCGARDQGDVWFIKKPHVNDLHPTMKPVELVERAVRNSSKSRDTVLDPFGGSGTTLIACEKAGRQARLIELEPKYCDVIIRRWQEFIGKEATLDGDGRTFAAIAGERKPSGGVNRPLPPRRLPAVEDEICGVATRICMGLCLALADWSAELRILEGRPWKNESSRILIPVIGLVSGLIGAFVGLQNRALLAEVRKELAELENRIFTRINGTYVRRGECELREELVHERLTAIADELRNKNAAGH